MDVNVRCQVLCSNVSLTKDESAVLGKRIRNNYYVHLYARTFLFPSHRSHFFIDLVSSIIFHVRLNFKISTRTKWCTNMVIVLECTRKIRMKHSWTIIWLSNYFIIKNPSKWQKSELQICETRILQGSLSSRWFWSWTQEYRFSTYHCHRRWSMHHSK